MRRLRLPVPGKRDSHHPDSSAVMIDGCGRTIDHLRLSLTEHCNLACRYCVPDGAPVSTSMILEEHAYDIVRWLSSRHGIKYVRLTGGEPLLYPHLISLVGRLARLGTLHEITLTTNGQALSQQACSLRRAGLTRVNVSLDTLHARRFAHLTRGGTIQHTLNGIASAVEAGLTPVKINVVVQRELNDEELPDIAKWGLAHGCAVRFLEVMPIGPLSHVAERHLVTASEILKKLRTHFDLRPIPRKAGQPAQDFAAVSGTIRGVIGIIAPTTQPFCSKCRRLRVTSGTKLVACVHDNRHFDLSPAWSGFRFDARLADTVLRAALISKPKSGTMGQTLTMLTIGG
jgi:cyclic pyranopterin phosphate synthase